MSVSGWYELIHLVIDKKHQRKGYGEAVICLMIEILQHKLDCQEIVIAYNPKNVGARRLYQKLGFVEFDYNYDGDPLMKLQRS
ncbi:MAG: N-acetyltransferase [Chloroflexi bacterium AL-W]|nr:N-acetyltransferase [Chloroflexi bacterium AL-N1]NOK70492.1 N-acetyltransferase [Chloroflexi bacterium AL-N10]NOK78149.1 N-acetyltransferase [Chloroflexi bacterium AL-N5]NOK85248.1 N-acetyltransferase [Chloroflexi bacterium AL-W]NOK92013.1 N-acetyltransferase [Chloroflexi bacterium AL-N15]